MSNIDEIKSRADIVDVIGKVVKLKKAGANYKGLCPFHNEKTPSFIVSDQKQIFTCFGCGARGDVLEFVQKYYGLDFREAMEQLAEQYGITLQQNYTSGEQYDHLYEINREAAAYFFKNLRKGPNPGLAYAAKRGLTKETLHDFGIGYAGEEWQGLYDYLKAKGYEDRDLLRLGLVSQSGKRIYDKFRNRLMFPIWNARGKIIGFGGRLLGDGEPKYLNSQESPIFQKKNNLYGLYQARETITAEDRAILVEGYMDVVSLHQAGIKNAVASLGTALTENQSTLIRRYTENVVLSYDSDDAGVAATLRGMDVLHGQDMNVRVMHVTDGKDPDDYIKAKGKDAYLELVDQARPFAEYKFGYYAGQHNLEDIQDRVAFMRQAVGVLKQLGPVEADMYVGVLSNQYNISAEAIRQEMGRQPGPAEGQRSVNREQPKVDMTGAEKGVIKLLLTESRFLEWEDVNESLFASDEGKILYGALRAVYQPGQPIHIEDVKDLLSDDMNRLLDDIQSGVLLPGNREGFLQDCLQTMKQQERKQRQERLIQQIALAEEEGQTSEVERLTKELIQLQQEIQQGGTNHGNS